MASCPIPTPSPPSSLPSLSTPLPRESRPIFNTTTPQSSLYFLPPKTRLAPFGSTWTESSIAPLHWTVPSNLSIYQMSTASYPSTASWANLPMAPLPFSTLTLHTPYSLNFITW